MHDADWDDVPVEEDEQRLRELYVKANPRQRLSVIVDRLSDNAFGPNKIVTLVSAIEAFARSLLVWGMAQREGKSNMDIYPRFRLMGPAELVGRYLSMRSTSPKETFNEDEWRYFIEATRYRHLLVHECTYLRGDKLMELAVSCEVVLIKLARFEGLEDFYWKRTNNQRE